MPAALLEPPATDRSPVPASLRRPRRHDSPRTLAGRLNMEWGTLSTAPGSCATVLTWAAARPVLAGAESLDDILVLIGGPDASVRDAALLALLELAQDGDALAGRTVLQAMLGKAVRIAAMVTDRPDMAGDRAESLSVAVTALWQVIATYPVAARPSRVAANLAMDTVAVVHRGHTGSSHRRRSFLEVPHADVSAAEVRRPVGVQPGAEQVPGPADAELFEVLAGAVRDGVLQLREAGLLARVYGVDEDGTPIDGRVVAAQEGVSWSTLRQRCHRLVRRLRAALTSPGTSRTDMSVSSAGAASGRSRPRRTSADTHRADRTVSPSLSHRVACRIAEHDREQTKPPWRQGADIDAPLAAKSETNDALECCEPAFEPWLARWTAPALLVARPHARMRSALTTPGLQPRSTGSPRLRGDTGSGAPRTCQRTIGPLRTQYTPPARPVDSSSDRVELLDLDFPAAKRCPAQKEEASERLAASHDRRHAMRTRRLLRSAALLVGLGAAILATAGCQSDRRDIEAVAPSPSPVISHGGSGNAVVTPTPSVPSEQAIILEQYRKFFAIQTPLIEAPAAERPRMLAEVAVDPFYSSVLDSIAETDGAGETFYGELQLNPVVQSVKDGTAQVRDCQDASRTGRMDKATETKVTVGRKNDQLLATMVRGDDGEWRMSHAQYQAEPC